MSTVSRRALVHIAFQAETGPLWKKGITRQRASRPSTPAMGLAGSVARIMVARLVGLKGRSSGRFGSASAQVIGTSI